eukprot:gnl/MRDRNA2_/MRDRNA2_30054_c0_seq1.p1 gnl/MRDRNA2_/MRDRNA2_30054_c0~~gnl/MRDRNA2_/MRDRNA2_30054_c0_seq1.p1  ORF type:complete len:304 (+),score=100.11 gnl/MRDRNA2_/MRDRNA2_30054_c0_seq1:91-1002(+)
MDLAEASQEEQLEYKREYAIRRREEEMKRKQDEELERKKQAMDEKKRREEREKSERMNESQESYSKAQKKKRAAQMENEYRERCREAAITKKRNNWLSKTNSLIQGMLEDYYAEDEELQERKLEAKERKNIVAREALEKRNLMLNAQKQRTAQRDSNDRDRAEARKERSIMRIDELKAELDDEIDQYIEHPTHIPLKQALCGGLRPVPTVTQLLAAMRDQEEDLADLKATILEDRARSLKKSLFTFVQEVKEGHEKARLKPPEPEIDEKRARQKQNMSSANTTKGSSTGFKSKGKENESPIRK